MLYFVDDNLNLLFILKMVYFFSCYSILPKTQVEKVQLMFKREYIYTNIVSTVYRVHFNIDEMELHETKWVLALEYIEVRFVLHPPQIQLFLCLLHLSSRCQCCLHLPPPPLAIRSVLMWKLKNCIFSSTHLHRPTLLCIRFSLNVTTIHINTHCAVVVGGGEEHWPFMCYKVKWYTFRSIIHWVNSKWKHCTWLQFEKRME